jgi:hypothetical protein
VTIAQTIGSAGSSTRPASLAADTRLIRSAPVGHRQPRAGDVPPENDLEHIGAEDAAVDRKINNTILRPGIQTLLQDAQQRQVDIVLTEDLSRPSIATMPAWINLIEPTVSPDADWICMTQIGTAFGTARFIWLSLSADDASIFRKAIAPTNEPISTLFKPGQRASSAARSWRSWESMA